MAKSLVNLGPIPLACPIVGSIRFGNSLLQLHLHRCAVCTDVELLAVFWLHTSRCKGLLWYFQQTPNLSLISLISTLSFACLDASDLPLVIALNNKAIRLILSINGLINGSTMNLKGLGWS